MPLARVDNYYQENDIYYYHTDQIGTPLELTNEQGEIAKDKVIASGKGTFGKKAPTGLADKNAIDIIINEKHVPLWRLAQ